ncbi:hypothetical protein NQ317_013469 [Molorchus minor]|uniref:Uncharacterized protein n=1 Tax=Molorchus minor TaxID=1323400 RepID=A0ABQ9J773_9CUCU|nr:hypothetical protein NQ317_013469 [Molorchus minor]
MEISFKGKHALVTGASKGIGRAIAIQLAKLGATVTAIGRSEEDLVLKLGFLVDFELLILVLFFTLPPQSFPAFAAIL